MQALLLYTLLSVACFFLGSRAEITRWLWSRYPKRLASFMDCSMCSGFWYGVIVAIVIGRVFELSYMGLAALDPSTPIVVGLCSMVLTPIVGAATQWSLAQLGTVVEE